MTNVWRLAWASWLVLCLALTACSSGGEVEASASTVDGVALTFIDASTGGLIEQGNLLVSYAPTDAAMVRIKRGVVTPQAEIFWNGTFTLSNPEQGRYFVQVTSDGYLANTTLVHVDDTAASRVVLLQRDTRPTCPAGADLLRYQKDVKYEWEQLRILRSGAILQRESTGSTGPTERYFSSTLTRRHLETLTAEIATYDWDGFRGRIAERGLSQSSSSWLSLAEPNLTIRLPDYSHDRLPAFLADVMNHHLSERVPCRDSQPPQASS